MKKRINLTFIVPCKNEEKYIETCINALLKLDNKRIDKEIIVVDNGSTDGTVPVLNKYKDSLKLLIKKDVTISELRNTGADNAKDGWLAFIDADVEICSDWTDDFIQFVDNYASKQIKIEKIVTGSTYIVREKPTWIEASWFKQLSNRDDEKSTYVNGGNLIIHSELFKEIGGFNTFYKTGEDVKLCQDAHKLGGRVIKTTAFRAIHHGYPKTIREFYLREHWHGLAMERYKTKPWKSKIALLSLYNLIVFSAFLFCFFLLDSKLGLTISLIAFLTAPLLMLSFFRSKGNLLDFTKIFLLFIVYSYAKTIAFLKILFPSKLAISGRGIK